MNIVRRKFLGVSAAGVAAAAAQTARPPVTNGVNPISVEERRDRIEKARRLMREHRMDALYMESGSTLFYFTGVRWGSSERMFAAVLPARGEIAYVCPAFEAARAREVIRIGDDIRTWEEEEDPARVVAGILKDRGIRAGTIGMEEYVRFVFFDGVRTAYPALGYMSATPVTAGCRIIKSAAEIALLQRANEITISAFRSAVGNLKEGMTQRELAAAISTAFTNLGVGGNALVIFGKASANPHGSAQVQRLREGDVVLIDGGCTVDGYHADVTRTLVFGKPTSRKREVWDLERRAQDAALAAAKIGATCESVDAAARKVITDAGFGPGYKLPGLPHRTGHGIGLDGHEWTNLVRGNKTPLEPGMCFSDEPTIAIPGEFGIRLEDCMYITPDGARMFTTQSRSITEPLA